MTSSLCMSQIENGSLQLSWVEGFNSIQRTRVGSADCIQYAIDVAHRKAMARRRHWRLGRPGIRRTIVCLDRIQIAATADRIKSSPEDEVLPCQDDRLPLLHVAHEVGI